MTLKIIEPLQRLICTEACVASDDFYFVYDQANCLAHPTLKNPNKPDVPLFLKPYYLIEKHVDVLNTLLIDDNLEKAMYNPFFTCIAPLPFEGDPKDTTLLEKLKPWLEGLQMYDGTIQDYVQENPFNTNVKGLNCLLN